MVRSRNLLKVIKYNIQNNNTTKKERNLHQMVHNPRSLKKVHNSNRINTRDPNLLIDRVCDTSLLGDGFTIGSTTNRSVKIQELADGIKIESLQIVSAISAIDTEEETIILEPHEFISVKNN